MKILFCLSLFLINFSVFANDNEADKILKKYIKAIGGKEQWENIKTIQMIYNEGNRGGNGVDWMKQISIARNVGYRASAMTLTSSGTGYFDNKSWRVLNPVNLDDFRVKNDTNTLTEQQKKKFKEMQKKLFQDSGGQIQDLDSNTTKVLKWQTELPWCLIDYAAKGYKAIYKGDAKLVNVVETAQIEITAPSGESIQCFLIKGQIYFSK